jgi:hypothetical protein
LTKSQRRGAARSRGREAAERMIDHDGGVIESTYCGAELKSTGGMCTHAAGQGTAHLGVGECMIHGGNSPYEAAKGAWLMAHTFIGELNITPWEALLRQVRRTAHEMAWLDLKVAECTDDDELLPGGSHYPWVKMRNETFNRHTRVAKMALDAGVAERLVAQMEFEAVALATVLMNTLNGLGLGPEQLEAARGIMRRELLALDAGTIEGEEVIDEHG